MVRFIIWLFSSKKTLVYTALNSDDYSRITAKLLGEVPYRVFTDSGPWLEGGVQSESTYDIYVRRKDEQRAIEAINKR